jgi:hypothetical protein
VCGAICDAAERGTACLVLGRDPALRAFAEHDGWRRLAIVGGMLRPMSQIALEGIAVDELLGGEPSAPAHAAASEPAPLANVLPFPIAARPAGVR